MKAAREPIVGTWKPRRDVVSKQIYDRFSSVGDHIQAAPTFNHAWETPDHKRLLEI